MSYSLHHTKRNGQHLKLIVDDVTTLPSLFLTIYTLTKLTKRSIGTQTNYLKALRFFYEFYERKHDCTFDSAFINAEYYIDSFLNEVDHFFDYLLSQQHLDGSSSYIPVRQISKPSAAKAAKEAHVAYVNVLTRYFRFLNDRYTCMDYQNCSPLDASVMHRQIEKKIKQITKEYSSLEVESNSPTARYKSLTEEQALLLDNMLLPSTEEFVDPDTGEVYSAVINPQNPFSTQFEQFRNYIIHRLMFQYGLRIGECLLLSLESFGPTLPDPKGERSYILLVQNLPDGVDDPRPTPPSIKTKGSQRKIKLEPSDYTMLTIYCEKRDALIKAKPEATDYGALFIGSRGDLAPLSYDAVNTYYRKIDSAFMQEHPYFRAMPEVNIEYMPQITPHVGRHTWAYITLEFIYNELFIEELELKRDHGIRARMKGLLDVAADKLRVLGGWTLTSRMPMRYANRFIEKVANDSNTRRTNMVTKRSQTPLTSTKDALPISRKENAIDNDYDDNGFGDFDEFQ
ncbi:site-specific integrase [Photobacterium damselae]|uniref:site-specific integrase n=1 Tax=Photobacterium damselae TaxID=38293 RepID=UPI001EDD3BC2|nr:site-specific integrase [Photobacterium damselae]MCG3815586.1 site-specific integrase [Photobacterium damselae]